jgi:PKD repeat protein
MMKMKYIIALCLVLSLVLPSTALAAQPNSSFKTSPTTGYAPVKVIFTYTGGSTAGVISHVWNYGDGATCRTCWHPYHIYKKAGTYKATLTVKTAKGSSTTAHYIVVKNRVKK